MQDLIRDEFGEDWKDMVIEFVGIENVNNNNDNGEGGGSPPKMTTDDPRRNSYCGKDWTQASTKCTKWCLGNDDENDCPSGETCYADTSCYYDDDLVPTVSPTLSPFSTKAPISQDHPANSRFCGKSWALATQGCSREVSKCCTCRLLQVLAIKKPKLTEVA